MLEKDRVFSLATSRRAVLAGGAAILAAPFLSKSVFGQGTRTVKLGILGDLSGGTRDVSGEGTLVLVKQAIVDFAKIDPSIRVEVTQADHQHKIDIGNEIARRWLDTGGADVILEVNNSALALSVANLVKEKDKVFLASGAATSKLSGVNCNENTIHWTYDTWMLGNVAGTAVTKQGGDSWFFVAPNYTFGEDLKNDTIAAVKRAGGTVLGSTSYPFPTTTDFSSQLLLAQSSGAKVIGLASSGVDAQNFVKQAREFGAQALLAPMQMLLNDIKSTGAKDAQGVVTADPWYWNLNDRTRGLTQRVLAGMPRGLYPATPQVGAYSATIHCLKAVQAMGGAESALKSGAALVKTMKSLPTDDDAFGKGRVREDGRKIHDVYLLRVKAPEQVTMEWDLLDVAATVPAEEAFRPIAEGGCGMIKS